MAEATGGHSTHGNYKARAWIRCTVSNLNDDWCRVTLAGSVRSGNDAGTAGRLADYGVMVRVGQTADNRYRDQGAVFNYANWVPSGNNNVYYDIKREASARNFTAYTEYWPATVSGYGAAPSGIRGKVSLTGTITAHPIYVPDATSTPVATRNSDSQITVTWSNNTSQWKPYTSVHVDRSVDGGAWTNPFQGSGSATSYVDKDCSVGHYYKYRTSPGNGTGFNTAWPNSNTVYMTALAPTAVNISKSAARTVNISVVTAQPSGNIELQYRLNGGAWTNLTTLTLPTKTYTHANAPAGTIQYRARCTWPGPASAYKESASVTTVQPPVAATNLRAANVVENGRVSDTKAVVSWVRTAPTDVQPRTGWRIYDGGTVVATIADSNGAGNYSATVNVAGSLKGIAKDFRVEAYGDGGTTITNYSNFIYGTLNAPAPITASSINRDWNGAYRLAVNIPMPSNYTAKVELQYRFEGDAVWSMALYGGGAYVIDQSTGYRFTACEVKARVVPNVSGVDTESHASSWTSVYTVPSGPYEPSTVSNLQRTEGDVSYCDTTFGAAMYDGAELADVYIVSYDQGMANVSVPATASAEYKASSVYMGSATLTVTVRAQRNGFYGRPVSAQFVYTPQSLQPPVITDAYANGAVGTVVFGDALYGVPRNVDGEFAYRYRVYLDGEPVESVPSDSAWVKVGSSHQATFFIYTPLDTRVTVSAIDDTGKESIQSNSQFVKRYFIHRDVDDVGIYAHETVLHIDDCTVHGFGSAILVHDGTVDVTSTSVRVPKDGKFYEVELPDDVVTGRSNIYERSE